VLESSSLTVPAAEPTETVHDHGLDVEPEPPHQVRMAELVQQDE
jgi:hypothetical protein